MSDEAVPIMTEATHAPDVAEAVQRLLHSSTEPLTVSKIRSNLPRSLQKISLEALTEMLNRQVVAKALYQFPKYRSAQDRFWDRPMEVHLAVLVQEMLDEEPLTAGELRRKLPIYAQDQADAVLQQQLTQGKVYRHPKDGRSGERFGTRPPDPKTYLRAELAEVFERLSRMGFTKAGLRAGALELLHEEEWASPGQDDLTTPKAANDSPSQP